MTTLSKGGNVHRTGFTRQPVDPNFGSDKRQRNLTSSIGLQAERNSINSSYKLEHCGTPIPTGPVRLVRNLPKNSMPRPALARRSRRVIRTPLLFSENFVKKANTFSTFVEMLQIMRIKRHRHCLTRKLR